MPPKIIFITGIGTGVGKTLVSAILASALEADYWKPVQAGFDEGTDSDQLRSWLAGSSCLVHKEMFRLKLPASPHLAAREEGLELRVNEIVDAMKQMPLKSNLLVVEGAGGLLVPLNETETMVDLGMAMNAEMVLVSRNYLGSINHSLLTAEACRQRGAKVAGWVFSDQFMNYEQEIVQRSGYPHIGSVPFLPEINAELIRETGLKIKPGLLNALRS